MAGKRLEWGFLWGVFPRRTLYRANPRRFVRKCVDVNHFGALPLKRRDHRSYGAISTYGSGSAKEKLELQPTN